LYPGSAAIGREIVNQRATSCRSFSGDMTYRNGCIRQIKQGAIDMTNEELVKRFIDSKAVNFDTIGKLVTELGPDMSSSKTHINMVLVGRPFILARMMPAAEAATLVGQLHGTGIADALTKTTG
jgi:ribosomal protein S17E